MTIDMYAIARVPSLIGKATQQEASKLLLDDWFWQNVFVTALLNGNEEFMQKLNVTADSLRAASNYDGAIPTFVDCLGGMVSSAISNDTGLFWNKNPIALNAVTTMVSKEGISELMLTGRNIGYDVDEHFKHPIKVDFNVDNYAITEAGKKKLIAVRQTEIAYATYFTETNTIFAETVIERPDNFPNLTARKAELAELKVAKPQADFRARAIKGSSQQSAMV